MSLALSGAAGVAALAGCAALESISQNDDLPIIPRGRTVIVQLAFPGDDPLPTAQRYCMGMGLTARPRTVAGTKASYDCI